MFSLTSDTPSLPYRMGVITLLAIILVYHPATYNIITYPHMYILNIPGLMGPNIGSTLRNLYFYALGVIASMAASIACLILVGHDNVLLPILLCVCVWVGLFLIGPGPNVTQMKMYVGLTALYVILAYRNKRDWLYVRNLALYEIVCYFPVLLSVLLPTPLTASRNTRTAAHRLMVNVSRLFEVLNDGFACQVIAERE